MDANEQEVEIELGRLHVKGLFKDQLCRHLDAAQQAALAPHQVRRSDGLQLADSIRIEIVQSAPGEGVRASSSSSSSPPPPRSASDTNVRMLAAVPVDQFGIPHSPFGCARSFLVERGFRDSPVILTEVADNGNDDERDSGGREDGNAERQGKLELKTVPASVLAPYVPHFHRGWLGQDVFNFIVPLQLFMHSRANRIVLIPIAKTKFNTRSPQK